MENNVKLLYDMELHNPSIFNFYYTVLYPRFTRIPLCIKVMPSHPGRGVADGGFGGVLTPHFWKPGESTSAHFTMLPFFFALNCINIKQQAMKILMLLKSILKKMKLTKCHQKRNFASPILVTTVMRQYLMRQPLSLRPNTNDVLWACLRDSSATALLILPVGFV